MTSRSTAIWMLPAVLAGAVLLVLAVRQRDTPSGRSSEPPTLRGGATLESDLPGGESRRFSVPVEADRYLRLEVIQHGVDALLRLFAPDGSLLVESDGINGAEGPESVSLVSERGGVYGLEVHAPKQAGKDGVGRVSVRIAERGPATPRNRRRVAADRKAANGRQIYFERGLTTSERAAVELAAAAEEFRLAEDPGGEADSRFVLAVVENELGRMTEALATTGRALELAAALEDPRREADALWMRGLVNWRLGEWRLAVDELTRAVALYRGLGDSAREARTLARLAAPYMEMGDTRRAREYAAAAVRVARPLGDSPELAEALNTLASAHLFALDPAPALPLLEEALAIGRRLGYRDVQIANLTSLGVALRQLARYEDAREPLDEAFAIAREIQNPYAEATLLEQLARTYPAPADTARRRELLELTLEASRRVRYDRGEAASLTDLAHGSLLAGDLASARRLIEEAVGIRERQWRRVPSTALQVGYLADQFSTYELYVDVLAAIDRAGMDPGAGALAFSVVDGARARALRQDLARARVEVEGEVPRALLDRRRELGRSLLAAETARRSGRTVEGRIDELEAELRSVERELALTSPRWAGLMLPEPITVEELQRDLLDTDTVVLEYALGKVRSHLFAIDTHELWTVELPARETIEAAARVANESVIARNLRVRFETPDERAERVAAADLAFARAAEELATMVLEPVAQRIAGKRLAVVADGALQHVPFGALPDPSAGALATGAAEPAERPPLALAHEIVQLPSASALREIRRQSRGRTAPTATLAVLADPVLRRDDPRIDGGSWLRPILASLGGDGVPRQQAGSDAVPWPDLPYAREEAESILALVHPGERLGAFGFVASRATAASDELSRYRIVHFATHAELDADQPELSGIVLSRFDRQGRAQDGLLQLYDVYDLRLGADLVVLSGCRTALGKEIRGEGLMGLTRGFMYAGAPRVIVSLWDVQDRATAELMKRMYASLLRESKRPAAALREAQREMAASPEWSAPYYWAGFVLQGDWR